MIAAEPRQISHYIIERMTERESLLETALAGVAEGLRTCFAAARPVRPMPGATAGESANSDMSRQERERSIRLMRVNHAGEVAAQALYNGQALFARSSATLDHLVAAAEDEHDHLAWCAQRLEELGGTPSRLTPLWYAGGYLAGVIAGLGGDQRSFGFIEETENQVEAHLEDHISRLPPGDERSREILAQMAADEIRHGSTAAQLGAVEVPALGRRLMGLGGSILRQVAQVL
jgi:ubiquinone biosynthesis monooxygenase Coq7